MSSPEMHNPFSELLTTLPNVGVVQFGNDGRIFYVNQGLCNLLGYSQKELLGYKILDLLNPDEDILTSKNLYFRKKDNSLLPTESNLRPICNRKGQPISYISLILDVSDRMKEAPKDKYCEAGKLSSCIIHEISNPLTIIKSRAQQISLMMRLGEEPERVVDCTQGIESAVSRIFAIVRSLEENGTDDTFGSHDLLHILNETMALSQERIKRENISVKTICTHDKVFINCVPVQISQVITNLLTNAFDAMADSTNAKMVQIQIECKDDIVRFSIQDSGPGVKQENWEKIFDPYFTTKVVGKGRGLGLGVSKMIVEAHNGAIRLDTEGQHTSFVCEFKYDQSQM